MTPTLEIRQLLCSMVALLALILAPSVVCANYSVGGSLDIYAYDSDGYFKENTNVSATSILDSETVNGDCGDFAIGAYYANLATASLGTNAYSYGDGDQCGGDGGASCKAYASFFETFTFDIAAGTYTEDLYVTLYGHLDGTIGSYGSATAYQKWNFALASSLGGDTFNDGNTQYNQSIDTDFSLTAMILRSGTYNNDRTVTATLSSYLKSVTSVPTLSNSTEGAWADVDYYSTGQFLSLVTPDGVTWTSASGVFLTDVPTTGTTVTTPIPTSIFLATIGFATSSSWLKRRRT